MDAVASQVAPTVKNLPANAGDTRDTGLIPGCGRSYGVGKATPLKNSCLKNSMGRGAWKATVHVATNSETTEHMDAEPVATEGGPFCINLQKEIQHPQIWGSEEAPTYNQSPMYTRDSCTKFY